jgi:hypothetical protein
LRLGFSVTLRIEIAPAERNFFSMSKSLCNSNLPHCFSKDGVLEAVRLKAERHVRSVLVLDDSKSIIGMFRLEENRMQFVPAEVAA